MKKPICRPPKKRRFRFNIDILIISRRKKVQFSKIKTLSLDAASSLVSSGMFVVSGKIRAILSYLRTKNSYKSYKQQSKFFDENYVKISM